MPVVPVHAPSRRYTVRIEPDVLDQLGTTIRDANLSPRAAHVIVDASLPPQIAERLRAQLGTAGITPTVSTITPTEATKTLQTFHHILQHTTAANLERSDLIIALGGGIVGDIAGFVAASYRRGIPWINVPTTLLSMVDASVGGKTGVNIRAGADLYKNMVGAFWQPAAVLADVSLLASLPERDFRSGLAECLKHALLSADADDPALLHDTKALLAGILARDAAALTELVARNVAVKARIVGTDEREEAPSTAGGRALLNLGHTFGHAIETISTASPTADKALAPVTHGESVALGLICAARYAELDRLMPAGFTEDIQTLVRSAGLPTTAHHLPTPADILARMAHDKKAAAGKLRLVIPCGPGRCRVVVDPPRDRVLRAIEAILP